MATQPAVGETSQLPPPPPAPVAPDVPAGTDAPTETEGSQRRTSSWVIRALFSNLALPLTSLATGPILARTLGPGERGELAAILTPMAFMPTLVSLGLQDATNVLVAAGRLSPRSALRTGTLPAVLSGVFAAGVLWLLAPLLLGSHPHDVELMRLGGLLLIPEMWFNILRGTIVGRGRFELANGERWLGALLRLALLAALAATGTLTLTTAVWVGIGSTVFGSVVLLAALGSHLRDRGAGHADHEKRSDLALMTSFGSRSWVGSLAGLLNARLDQSILLPFVGAAALGQYTIAVTLATTTVFLAGAVRLVLMTRASGSDGAAKAAAASRALVIIVGAAAVVGVLTSPFVIPLLFGSAFKPAVPLAQLLFVGSIPTAVNAALSAGLMGADHPGQVSIAEGVSLVVTGVGLAALVGPMGVTGAAVTSLLAYSATTYLLVRALRRVAGVRIRDCLVPRPSDLRRLLREVQRMLPGVAAS